MSPIVAFEDVWYTVGGRDVLRGLSFEMTEGETVVLVGRSGEGKTTTLRLVNAMLFPNRGDVRVEGTSTRDWDPIRLRRRIGYVIQEAGLFPHFTVAANVGLVPRLEGWLPDAIRERVGELLEQVGLPPAEFASRYPRELSGGQRQRVGVARALAADPPLLLFDEPFGALDPVTRLELERLFLSLTRASGKTSLFVTHDLREAMLVGSRIGVMRDGRVEALMPPAEFRRSADPDTRAFVAGQSGRPEL